MMHDRLRPTLALLDQGLSLYRRNFTSFALIAAAWFVPVAILFGLGWAVAVRQGTVPMIGLAILGVLLAALLLLYLMGALSRAANLALDDQPLRLRAVFGISPLRMLGMTLFSMLYTILSQIVLSVLSMVLICPLYFVILLMAALFGASSSLGGTTGGMLIGIGSGIMFIFVYMASLFLSGATLGGLVYGLQPWAYGYGGFGKAIQRGIDMIAYRFIKNVGIWGCAAIILVGAGAAVSILLSIAAPLPVGLLLGEDSPLTVAVTVGAWLISMLLVLPPLPIWMAMHYRSNLALREGLDLQQSVDMWWRQIQEAAQPLEG